ncbi:MAG: selenoneine biosynthesis selenosugar synthase SenB [Burkholderiaceae bacterium]|nr:selenoneine biosynthesis selenosugar synthase SenB [Burkholderiaceae bacterium]
MPTHPSIVIISPALAAANNGNWQTARRWQAMLSGHYRVEIMQTWNGEPFDAMLALHARRSADAIARWAAAHPDKPLVLVLTGTDLYRDIAVDAQAQQSLQLAQRLIVLQELGPRSLPVEFRSKCRVIFQSTPRRQPVQKTTQELRAVMVGHLRAEKSPQTYFAAARALAHRPDIVLEHIGAPLDAALGEEARRLAAEVPNYRYLGELSHEQTLEHIANAHVLVHPSQMEGGAHVVMEAVMCGTPVLASRIDGNVGMLGFDYAGYFDCGHADQLVQALLACRDSQNPAPNQALSKLAQLARQCNLRSPLFEPETEQAGLLKIFDTLFNPPS